MKQETVDAMRREGAWRLQMVFFFGFFVGFEFERHSDYHFPNGHE